MKMSYFNYLKEEQEADRKMDEQDRKSEREKTQ